MQTLHFIMRASLPQTLVAIALLAAGCSEKPSAPRPSAGYGAPEETRNKQLAQLKTEAESAKAAQSKMMYEVTKRFLHGALAEQIKSRIETGGGYAAAMAKTFNQVGLANVYKEGEESRLAFEIHARNRLKEREETGPVFGKMLAMIEKEQYPADELKGFALAAQKLDEEEDADYWSPLIVALSQNKLGTAFTMYKGHGQTVFSVKRRELIVKIEAACGPRPPQ